MTSASVSASDALLSLEASEATRALHRWCDDELDRFARAVDAALEQDFRRWGAVESSQRASDVAARFDARHAVHAEDVAPAERSVAWHVVAQGAAWWHLPEAPERLVCRTLFGQASGGAGVPDARRIADEVSADVWAGQLQALDRLVGGDGDSRAGSDPAQAWRRWSGAVHLSLPWCGAVLQLLFSQEQVAYVISRIASPGAGSPRTDVAPLTPVLDAARGLHARLELRLDSFEIDLGSLFSLGVGDVLHVGHALDKPVHVCAARAPLDDDPLCTGWLGQRDGALAVELARAPRNPSQSDPHRAKSFPESAR